MIQRLSDIEIAVEEGALAGLRMTADEFLEANERVPGYRYELVDGVVIMTPTPVPLHQRVAMEIARQLGNFLEDHPVGEAFHESSVKIGKGPTGADLVYEPDIVYYKMERLPDLSKNFVGPPDLVVEVVSPSSRLYDRHTKKDDYERLGVSEYWLIDPREEEMTFFRLEGGQYKEIPGEGNMFRSSVVQGFSLDLQRIRAKWKVLR